MPNVTATPRGQSTGELHTEFTDSVGTVSTTYTYPTTQEKLKVTSKSNGSIQVTVNGTTRAISSGAYTEFLGKIDSFAISSLSDVQSFEVLATNLKDIDEVRMPDLSASTTMMQRGRRVKQPLVTFIDDDGYPDVLTKLKPLSLAKNFPFVISLFQTCDLMQNHLSEVQGLQDKYGWEIACHTQYHTNLINVPLSQAESEFVAMRDLFNQTGLNVNHLVYPQGGFNVEVKRLAAKYYRSGVNAGGGVNSYPLKTMELMRVPFGFSAPAGQNDLSFYKSKVDEAVANNSWVIFMTHCYQATHDAVQQQALSDLVDYIQSISVKIVTLDEGFNLLSNALDVGEMTDSKHFIVDCEGTQYISDLVFKPIPKTGITNATLVTSFPKGYVSATSFVNSDNVTGFPDGVGGVLLTFRIGEIEASSYQLWYPYNSTKMYRRRWDDAATNWTSWDSYATKAYVDGLNTMTVNTTMNSFTNANVITDFSYGKVTVCAINNAASAGLPGGGVGGLLTTYRFAGNGWDRQEYRKYNSNEVWSRYTDATTGAWTAWTKISVV